MFGADAVMDTVDPGLQVGEDQVDDWQELFRDLRVAAFGDGMVVEAALSEASIAAPVVGDDQRSGNDGVFDESAERMGATVGDDSQTNASRVATVFPIVELGSRLAAAHLHGAGNENFVVDAPAFAAGPSSHPGFIHFDMFLRLAANLVTLGAHHPGAQFMKDAEGRLIARQAELTLKLDGRHSRRLAGDQVSRPEPDRQRRVAALQDGPGHQAYVLATGAAAQNAGTSLEAKRLTNDAAPWANKPFKPASAPKIGGTGRVVRENALKLRQRSGERQVFACQDIHGQPLNLVGMGVNRIGKIRSIEFPLPRTMISPTRQSISSSRSLATSPDRIPRRTNMVRMAMSR